MANGTHNRNGAGSVTLGNGARYTGASMANAVPASPMIDAAAAGLPGADPLKVELCYSADDNAGAAVLDPAKVAGLSFLCGAQPGGGCTGVTPMDPSNLNQASIAIGDLAGVQTVTRKLKNVSGSPLTVAATVAGMAGFNTTVTPSGMTLAPSAEGSFTGSFLRTGPRATPTPAASSPGPAAASACAAPSSCGPWRWRRRPRCRPAAQP